MRVKDLDGQLQLNIFEPAPKFTPGDCPHESATVDIGGGKTFCESMGMWTNCLEVNHCVYAACKAS